MATVKKPAQNKPIAQKTGKNKPLAPILAAPSGPAPAPAELPAKKLRTDWEAVERDYRTGKFTLRELGTKHRCDNGLISRKAKNAGWKQDLSKAIKQATNAKLIEDLVSKEISSGQHKVSNTVLAAAEVNTQVILGHRLQVKEIRAAAEAAKAKLIALGDTVADIREAGAFAGAVESLSRTYKNLIDMERKAFRLDDEETPESELAAMSDEDLDARTEKLLERHRPRR